ncbi:MAG: hypothetical protein ACREFD_10285 [Stellaceae bacterium]
MVGIVTKKPKDPVTFDRHDVKEPNPRANPIETPAQRALAPSRRQALTAALQFLAFGAVVASAGRAVAAAQKKIAKTIVHYQTHPHGKQTCANCTHFQPPHSCALVAGRIIPTGWCMLYGPKKA